MDTATPTIHTTHKGNHEILFTEGNHRYKVDGDYKDGVTSVLGLIGKDALAPWAANMVVKYIEENCRVITFPDDPPVYSVTPEDLAIAKKYHITFRDGAADVGKRVHKWIELHLAGEDTEVTQDMLPSVNSYLAWELKYQPEIAYSERITYSERLDLCGTTDLVCMIDGKRTVLDFKTGKPEEEYNPRRHQKTGRKRAYTAAFIQDAFYDVAIEEEDGLFADQYAVLYLPVTGDYEYYVMPQTELFRNLAVSLRQTQQLLKQANYANTYEGEMEL